MRAFLLSGVLALAALIGSAEAQQQPAPVIDVHMHAPLPNDMENWRATMDELNVRHAIFFGTPARLAGIDRTRFVPSVTFPCEGGEMPNIGGRCFDHGEEWPPIDQLRAWIREGRVAALGEVNAQYMGAAPNDPRLEPYFALAEESDVPVCLHLGIGPPGAAYVSRQGFPPHKSPNYRADAGDPRDLEDVLVRHPNLRVYIAHGAWPMREELLYMLYMHPQLYIDVSVLQWAIPRAAYYSYLRDLVEAGFANRIMFGSDGSTRRLREGIDAIQNAVFLTEEQKRAILYDNAARFFRLDQPH